jgi:hypothetical protein
MCSAVGKRPSCRPSGGQAAMERLPWIACYGNATIVASRAADGRSPPRRAGRTAFGRRGGDQFTVSQGHKQSHMPLKTKNSGCEVRAAWAARAVWSWSCRTTRWRQPQSRLAGTSCEPTPPVPKPCKTERTRQRQPATVLAARNTPSECPVVSGQRCGETLRDLPPTARDGRAD